MSTRPKTSAVLFLLCGALAAAIWPAGPSRALTAPSAGWTVVGPGGGGTMRKPTIHWSDPRRVLVGCDMTGAYLTEDGGESWRMFNLGTDVASFAFDPSNPDTLYTGTAALWKSMDRGRTWTMAFPDPAKGTRMLSLGDHGDQVLRTDDPTYPGPRMSVQAIAAGGNGTLTIAVSGGGVFRGSSGAGILAETLEDGLSWRVIRTLPPEAVHAMRMVTRGHGALVTDRHVLVQDGDRWLEHGVPPGHVVHAASVTRVRLSPGGEVAVTAATHPATGGGSDGVFRTEDGGRTWIDLRPALVAAVAPASRHPANRDANPSTRTWRFRALSASAGQPGAVYAGFELEAADGQRNRESGIVRSDDGGRTWRVALSEGTAPSAAMEGSWFEARASEGGPDVWFDAPYDMTVSETNPDIVYATDLFRSYRTLDGGVHWAQVHSRKAGPDAWTSSGLDVTTNYGVHADPFDGRRLLLSNTDIGLFRSEDGGASWIPSSAGMPQPWRNTTYWVEFDPAERGVAWAAFSGTHDLPRPKMWRRRDPSTFQGGIGISRDGGRTWTPAPGLPVGAVTHVWLDPASPVGRRELYATLFGRGVYKSIDGGLTWVEKNKGLRWRQPFAWRIVPAGAGRLYLVVSRRSENGSIGNDEDGALLVSDDGADSWREVRLPEGTNGPTGVAVDPADRAHLYLSAWGRAGDDADTGGGVFESRDAGATWRHVFAEGQHVYDVTLDPRNGSLYASGFDQGAWRSTDRGATWQRIEGYTFKWGHRVIPDRATPDRVYVTTFGGGLWHGPAMERDR
jgi:hypothetical protein